MHPLYYEKLITIIPLSLQMKSVYFILSTADSLELESANNLQWAHFHRL